MLPIWNKTPKFLKPILKQILKLKYGLIHKLIYVASIPAMWFEEFVARIKAMPRMLMMTRSALMNDDWDKSYKDIVTSSPIAEIQSPDVISFNKEKSKIDAEKLAIKKAEQAEKEKRRNSHFFHGKINFPQ